MRVSGFKFVLVCQFDTIMKMMYGVQASVKKRYFQLRGGISAGCI